MGVVRKQAGAQSASFFVTSDPGDEGPITNFNIKYSTWAHLPTGKLKDLLTAAYLTEAGDLDPSAFIEALATNGAFQVTSAYNTQEVEDSLWDLAAAPSLPSDPPKGTPILNVTANGAAEAGYFTSVRVSCSYSASE